MLRFIFLLFFIVCASSLKAQLEFPPVQLLSFESCDVQGGVIFGDLTCECGAIGESGVFDGITTDVKFTNSFATNYPSTGIFTINLYFKATGQGGNYVLFSKRNQCTNDNYIQVGYELPSRTLSVEVAEDVNNFSNILYTLPEGSCWNMITIVKVNNLVKLYHNGTLVGQDKSAGGTIDLGTTGPWSIGSSPCVGSTFRRFRGNIDEFSYYARELSATEIMTLYVAPDRIDQRDTTLFLGDTLDLSVINTCANQFEWTPSRNIDNRFSQSVKVFPEETQSYTVDIEHTGCISKSKVNITVVDPASADCSKAYLPNAFTPNGDPINESFKIDNPVVIGQITSLEVYDHWGARVFYTTDIEEGWDGTIQGEDAMPGVYAYKLIFEDCLSNEQIVTGALTLIR